jgi:hypothetical protein
MLTHPVFVDACPKLRSDQCEGEPSMRTTALTKIVPSYPPPIFGISTISLSGRSTALYAS